MYDFDRNTPRMEFVQGGENIQMRVFDLHEFVYHFFVKRDVF